MYLRNVSSIREHDTRAFYRTTEVSLLKEKCEKMISVSDVKELGGRGSTKEKNDRKTASDQQTSHEVYKKKLYKLTIAGGAAFWLYTITFSLLPIVGDFRAAFSISYFQADVVQSLFVGLITGACVSYFLLRLFNKIPTRNPILKSVILTFVPLSIALILLVVAVSTLGIALHYFLIGAALNASRFLILGIVIGYVYDRLDATHSTF